MRATKCATIWTTAACPGSTERRGAAANADHGPPAPPAPRIAAAWTADPSIAARTIAAANGATAQRSSAQQRTALGIRVVERRPAR